MHEDARIDELLDVISLLVQFSRAGTFDEDPGEVEVWREALAVLERYRPAAANFCVSPSVFRTDK